MKLLLPIDKSDCSDAAVEAIIAQFPPAQTEVRIVHVVDWPVELPTYLAFAEGATAGRDLLEARGMRIESGRVLTGRVAQRLQAAGFTTSEDVREGEPAEKILQAARQWHPDVIVIGSHGRAGLGRLILGSVAETLVHHAGCPVEVVPMGAHAQLLINPGTTAS